jgi:hypothetical protein
MSEIVHPHVAEAVSETVVRAICGVDVDIQRRLREQAIARPRISGLHAIGDSQSLTGSNLRRNEFDMACAGRPVDPFARVEARREARHFAIPLRPQPNATA